MLDDLLSADRYSWDPVDQETTKVPEVAPWLRRLIMREKGNGRISRVIQGGGLVTYGEAFSKGWKMIELEFGRGWTKSNTLNSVIRVKNPFNAQQQLVADECLIDVNIVNTQILS